MPDFKSLFATPQKARITVICLLVSLATLGAVAVYIVYALRTPGAGQPPAPSAAQPAGPSQSPEPGESAAPSQSAPLVGIVPYLTIDQARELALTDAGLSGEEADISREALTEDNGIWVYEFRFSANDTQYEYLINANTGEVRSMVKESVVHPSPGATQPPMPSLPAVPESTLPEETAPQPSPAPSPTAQPAQSPDPAGTPEPSPDASPAPSQPDSLYIGMSRAKAIALERAGLTGSHVTFTRARMARADGRMAYLLEFRWEGAAYSYQIDASTGRVLSSERTGD